MPRRFDSQQEIDVFLAEPRLAMLLYNGARPSPTGVPVWFDWDGQRVQMFADKKSPKVRRVTQDPQISVVVTNHMGEQEGWVAFDGRVEVSDFAPEAWVAFIDKVAPRYWDLSDANLAQTYDVWRSDPETMASLSFIPEIIRSGP